MSRLKGGPSAPPPRVPPRRRRILFVCIGNSCRSQMAEAIARRLGSDVMDASLKVYGLLKLTGRSEGLDGLRRELGNRFHRTGKPAAAPEAEAA